MKRKLSLTVFGCLITGLLFAQTKSSIKDLFNSFNKAYQLRDTSSKSIDNFTEQLLTSDVFIMGTGTNEFVNGSLEAKKLVKNDWAYWLNLNIDTGSLVLNRSGDIYLFSIKGTASIRFPTKLAAYDYGMSRVNQINANDDNSRLKLLAISQESSNLINEIEKGNLDIKYLIRLNGAVIKQDGHWKFKQLNFSFPYPMQRITNE